jgi:hypothetical protein
MSVRAILDRSVWAGKITEVIEINLISRIRAVLRNQ